MSEEGEKSLIQFKRSESVVPSEQERTGLPAQGVRVPTGPNGRPRERNIRLVEFNF